MSNPILSQGFRQSQQPVVVVQDPYGQQQQIPLSQIPAYGQQQYVSAPRMTFDDVMVKSLMTLGILVMTAGVTYVLTPPALVGLVALIGSLTAFVTAIIVQRRHQVGAVGAIAYAAIEGVFVGGFSAIFESYYPGIIVQAVLGTFAAAALTFAAYRTFNIKVGNKARRILGIATGGFAIAMLASVVLQLFGLNAGLYDSFGEVSILGVGMTALGSALAVFSLVTDFDDIEKGIRMGAPAEESWRAAFALTVTMVWLYTNILRILSYLRD
ncbi:MAG: Bax inhibitor-1/YccA family protein [Propionibacteriaceae bacterium]